MSKKLFLILFLVISTILLHSEIRYRISGKVVYNGVGIANQTVKCEKSAGRFSKEIVTDKDGNFQFFVPNGIYAITIENQKDFVSREPFEIITVKNKNIKNILIFLEKGCTVSGYIKFEDNTPIKNATVFVYNERGGDSADTNENGFYKISAIRFHEKTHVKVYPTGSYVMEPITDMVLIEGQKVENLNIFVPKNISISGKIIDKVTKKPLENMDITLYGKKELVTTLKSDVNGKFECFNIPTGKYRLHIFDYNRIYKPYISEIETRINHIKEILIEMEEWIEK